MSGYPRWTMLLLPYTRRELPAWGRLLALAGVESWRRDSSTWAHAPTVTLRGKTHGFLMRLDLYIWAERRTFFIGRYYELHLQLLLAELLRAGDRMLDVGANVGMITLFASRLVGSSGRIESFEPNPDCVRRLEDNLRLNDIRNVVIHPAALAEAPSRMTLRLQTSRTAPSRHSGTGTLAPVEESADDVIVGEYPVDVARGDDVVGADTRHAVSVIKLDVEGFELNALKGLHETLARWGPAVITEYMDEHLARAGASRGELRAWMEGLGYEAFAFYTRRRGLRHSLMVEEVARAERAGVHINDVLWLQPRHAQYRRFASGGGMTARTSS